MLPIWLIEADVFGRSFEPLKAEIRQQGMVWEIVQARTFLNNLIPMVRGYRLTDRDCVVFSGTYPLMRHLQLHYRWVPGGWCTAEHFDCAHYYAPFGRHLLNQGHALLRIDEALHQREELFARFAKEDQMFVRPAGVQKTFTGRCMNRDAFARALESARYAGGAVLVASPQPILCEWRVVVARGQFIAASQYRSEGRLEVEPGCPREVRAYVESLLAEVSFRPDPIFMMDVCASRDRLFLLELNSFSCSGLYQCDPAAVVREVKHLATEAWQKATAALEGAAQAKR
jgi:hypothetical protein